MLTKRLILILLLGLASMPARASLQVFACEPEWADLVKTLVPDARIKVATTAWQDPHYIEARPSLIAAMSRADLAVCTGASLEAGWLPALINKASNQRIREGKPGLFFAAEQVPLYQPHDHVDRSMGDVHSEGDPHIHLDPERVPLVMEALADRLSQIAPELENDLRRRHLQWRVQWNLQKARWQKAAEELQGTGLVVQHADFGYLLRWLGVDAVLDLEPKPGLPPSASHLSKLLAEPELEKASAIMIALYQDDRPATWLSERTNLPVLTLPGTVTDEHQTLSEVISHLVARLVAQNKTADHNG
ncbi:MAG: zinc ABC transporter substrate-binding protein [Oleiphilaceae bacterium]|nr:zinc ABC transporter substrate-binding protein [Oleiphilaceae bacterium]